MFVRTPVPPLGLESEIRHRWQPVCEPPYRPFFADISKALAAWRSRSIRRQLIPSQQAGPAHSLESSEKPIRVLLEVWMNKVSHNQWFMAIN
jgi:hypothetical protein